MADYLPYVLQLILPISSIFQTSTLVFGVTTNIYFCAMHVLDKQKRKVMSFKYKNNPPGNKLSLFYNRLRVSTDEGKRRKKIIWGRKNTSKIEIAKICDTPCFHSSLGL